MYAVGTVTDDFPSHVAALSRSLVTYPNGIGEKCDWTQRAGGPPFHTTRTNAVEFPGGPSFAPLFYAKGAGLHAPRSANPAKCNPSFLPLTLVSISTNIQRPTNVLA